MRILVLNPRFDPPLGGATGVCLNIIDILETEGHSVTYISGADRSWNEINEFYDLEISESEFRFLDKSSVYELVSSSSRFTVLERSMEDRAFLDEAKRLESNFDLIILGRHVFDAPIEFDIPVIQYVHDYLNGVEGKNFLYRNVFERFSKPVLFEGADQNLYNSDYVASKNELPGRILYPPVDDKFDPSEKKLDQAVIVGRISRDKNFEEAIEIVRQTDLELKIVGSLQDERYYRELKGKENVLVETDVSRDRLREVLENSKIGISTKREENFGMNVAEYMKAGALPMVYDYAGPAEIVEKDFFKYSDPEEASEKIQENLERFNELRPIVLDRSKDFSRSRFEQEFLKIMEEVNNI